MRALVTFALQNEFEPWRKSHGFQRMAVFDQNRIYAARVGSVDVQVILTGAGRFAAQRALTQPLQVRPDFIIASGLAGGLKPSYLVGEVLVAHGVADANGVRFIPSDVGLVKQAADVGATRVNRFLVSDHAVSTMFEKSALADAGDAVDMESIYILAAAAQQGIPAVAIRAVSDDADSDLPLDFNLVFNEKGMVSLPKVVRETLKHPGRIRGLLKLADQSQRAAETLAAFLDRYLENISEGPYEHAKAEALAV